MILTGCQSPMPLRLPARYATVTHANLHASGSWPYCYTIWVFSDIKEYKDHTNIDTFDSKLAIYHLRKSIRKSCYLRLPDDWYQQLHQCNGADSVVSWELHIAELMAKEYMITSQLYVDKIQENPDIRSFIANPKKNIVIHNIFKNDTIYLGYNFLFSTAIINNKLYYLDNNKYINTDSILIYYEYKLYQYKKKYQLKELKGFEKVDDFDDFGND